MAAIPAPPAGTTARSGAVDNVRGAAWVVLASVLFTSMIAMTKYLGQDMHAFVIGFWRAVLSGTILLPFLARAGFGVLITRRWRLNVTRAMLGSMGLLCGFYAIVNLPLAEATALSFTKPLFQVLLAALVLRETVRAPRWISTSVGFVGVLFMMSPGGGFGLSFAVLVALLGSCFSAGVSVTLRHLVQSERRVVILAYLALTQSIIAGTASIPYWSLPSPPQLAVLLAMALTGSAAQLCLMRGLTLGEASAMAPIDFVRLPLSALLGLLLFNEGLSLRTVAGAVVIAGSTLYIVHREASAARHAAHAEALRHGDTRGPG